MASTAGSIRAGKAHYELWADDTRLARGLRMAETKVKAWGHSVGAFGAKLFAAGTAGSTALFAAAKVFSDTGDALAKMSVRTGISVEQLSTLGFAAERSGADLESLETGVRKMQKSITDAATGSNTASEALGMLGISLKQLSGLSPDEQFKLIGDRIGKIPDPTLRAGMAMEVFGKSGTKLLPLFAEGADGIERLQKRADDFGRRMSGADAAAAEKLQDALGDLWGALKGTAIMIGASVAPMLTDFATRMAEVAGTVSKWIGAHRGLIVSIAAVVVGVTALGGAIIAVGLALSVTGAIIGGVATLISALLSPVGIALALLLGGAAAALYFSGALSVLSEDATQAFGAIATALSKGDIVGAAKLLWSLIKLEWAKGIASITELWDSLVAGVSGIIIDISAMMETAWASSIDFMKDAWDGLVSFMLGTIGPAFATLVGLMTQLSAKAQGMSDETAETAAKFARVATLAAINASKGKVDRGIVDREQARNELLSDIEQRRTDAQQANAEMLSQKMIDAQNAVNAAQAEFDATISAAGSSGNTLADVAVKKAKLNGLNLDALTGGAVSGVSGTFSAAAAGATGSGGDLKKLVQQGKAGNDLLKNINENIENLGIEIT